MFFLTVFICVLAIACGKNNPEPKNQKDNPGGIEPCELLTSEQVSTVLPGHDEGYVAHSGGSLIEGVDSYQCSYSDEGLSLFTVILHVAVDKKRFDEIKLDPSTYRMDKSVRELKIGDGGWLYGEPDDMKLKAEKGFTVLEFELLAKNAGDKKDKLVELASSIMKKIK